MIEKGLKVKKALDWGNLGKFWESGEKVKMRNCSYLKANNFFMIGGMPLRG